MSGLAVERADIDAEPAGAREAAGRFELSVVDEPRGAAFDEAFEALSAEFGHKGELERRDVIVSWVEASGPVRGDDGITRRYRLVVARDRAGALAGVRDCHVTFDPAARVAVVYLAHTLVLPPFRRSGLAALLRAAPGTLARAELRSAGLDPSAFDVLLAAEMEPADTASPETLVRLVSYGRAGFRAIEPASVRYRQPDFRDLAASAGPARPIPLLAVVRGPRLGGPLLPKLMADAYVRHLYAVFASHCRAADLAPLLATSLAAIAAAGDAVPLLPLPASPGDAESIARLTRDAVR